jgi:hypothetical protein
MENYNNSGIYMLYHLDNTELYNNNYYYIGQAKDIHKRLLFHSRLKVDCGYGIIYQFILSRGEKICYGNKCGEWGFRILSENPAKSKKELNDMEKHFCNLYKPKLTMVFGDGLHNPYRISNEEKKNIKSKYYAIFNSDNKKMI